MKQIKSPFLVYQEFLSALLCEEIVDSLDLSIPNEDVEGNPLKMVMHHERLEDIIYHKFLDKIPNINNHYDVEHNGTTEIDFEWIPQGCNQGDPVCENSRLMNVKGRNKWARVRNRDLTCVLFLSSYCNKPNFDSDYEVYGGKLNFPAFDFGFNPERGTLIIYPSGPNFINLISPIIVGDLILARFHISTKMPFVFDIDNFNGSYHNWFNEIS